MSVLTSTVSAAGDVWRNDSARPKISNPPVGLHEYSWAEILVLVPPVRRA